MALYVIANDSGLYEDAMAGNFHHFRQLGFTDQDMQDLRDGLESTDYPEVDESDESDESDEDEDGDEEEEDGEPKYDVKCIHAQKGKGKTLQYQVAWDGWAELTWEPGSFMLSTFALREWEESGKAAWEASKKQQPKK